MQEGDLGEGGKTHFTPTPAATNTTCPIPSAAPLFSGGGNVKLPPALTCTSLPSMRGSCCHSQAAGGLWGAAWMASCRRGRREGGEMIVKPPGERASGVGTWTSTHWPGLNCVVSQ